MLLYLAGFYLGFLVWGEVIVDGGCRHRLQFSRGVWGDAPPEMLSLLRVVLRHSETVSRSL